MFLIDECFASFILISKGPHFATALFDYFQLIAKLAEDERVEQLSAQKKRLKMLQLRKDVEQTMIERRQKRAEEMQRIMRLLEEEEKEKIER